MSPRGSCLTCRSRKAKCDRLLPRCSTCSKLDCPCLTPRRNAELLWLRPEANNLSDLGPTVQDAQLGRHGSSGRRNPFLSGKWLALGKDMPARHAGSLTISAEGDERDRHIAQIASSTAHTSLDALLEQIDAERNLMDATTFSRGPFSVFQIHSAPGCPTENTAEAGPGLHGLANSCQDEVANPAGDVPPEDFASLSGMDEQDLLLLLQQETCPAFDPDASLWEHHDWTTLEDNHQGLLPEDSRLQLQEDYQPSLQEVFSSAPDALTPGKGLPVASISSMPTAYVSDISDLDFHSIRVLLDRYRNSLVPCFLPVQKYQLSPWEILHIPKVHEALGNVIVQGDADNAKISLLFAVLGASAFHIHVQMHPSGAPGQQWRILGEEYRVRARERLTLSLKECSSTTKREDLSDILLALTSMFTVCVVSGSVDEAYVYLREVSRLSATAGMEPNHTCPRLRTLQNIFFYIRTLQDSLGVFRGENLDQALYLHMGKPATTAPVNKDMMQQVEPRVNTQDTSYQNGPLIPTRTICPGQGHCCSMPTQEMFEHIFSLPVSLFRLISRVTLLIHETENPPPTHAGQPSLANRISQLETDIWDWKTYLSKPDQNYLREDLINPSPICDSEGATLETRDSSSESPLQDLMEAMHSALLIHFYRCIRKLDPLMIQHLVDKTVECLVRCTNSRRVSNDPSSNICWPLFIAGSEALNAVTRQQVTELFNGERARTGMRMFEMAAQAIRAVWTAREQENNRNLSWSKVLRENAMLTRLILS